MKWISAEEGSQEAYRVFPDARKKIRLSRVVIKMKPCLTLENVNPRLNGNTGSDEDNDTLSK